MNNILYGVMACVCFCVPASAQTNLVKNPGFEDPQLAPWNNAPPRDGVTTENPRSGKKGYKIEVKPTGGSTHGLFYNWQSIKGNWQGKRFKFSAWMRLVNTGDSTIAIKFYKTFRGSGGYEKVHCISWRKGTMDWTHFEGVYTAQDTTQEILIYMLCQPGTGVAYCDDFHLELLDDTPPMGWNTSGRRAEDVAVDPDIPELPELRWEKRSDWIDVTKDVTPAAVGDGVADDTAALQAAFDKVRGNGSPFSTVYFPPGTYSITQVIDPKRPGYKGGWDPRPMHIRGHGRSSRIVWGGAAGGRSVAGLRPPAAGSSAPK